MANPTKKMKSGVTAVWGTGDAGAPSSYGIVRSVERVRGAEKEPLPDGDGNTAGFTIYDEKDEFVIEVACKESVTNPTIGATLTVNAVSAYIMDWKISWQHKGYKGITINCTRYVDGAIP